MKIKTEKNNGLQKISQTYNFIINLYNRVAIALFSMGGHCGIDLHL